MSNRNRSNFTAPKIPSKIALPLCALAFFFVVCLSAVSTVKPIAVLSVVLAFAGGFAGFKNLRDRFTLPMVALALFVAIGGISTFYAVSGKFALQEFLKLLISFCLAVFMLSVTRGKDATPARRIASVLESFTAIAGFVSIDMISTRIISSAVVSILQLFSTNYSDSFTGLEVGIRIISLFQNPNVFGSIVGLGVLLSLGLVLSSENQRERTGHLICLYLNALSFLLAFSMGSIAFIAVAFVLYLFSELPSRRAPLFVLMVETLVLTLVSTALISMTSFDEWTGIRVIPILCAVVGSAALWLTDRVIGQPIGQKLSAHGKLLTGFICAVLAALVVFALAAYNLTGPLTLTASESVRRSAYPAPGEYTLSAKAEGPVSVAIRYQNEHDTMMHTETLLYEGPLSEAAFTVPEDSLVVYFTFSCEWDSYLESVECVGDSTVSIPLDYRLLPSFIANRLQGLFANENAIQRMVFFEDGMKIFERNPLFGLGLGSYENGIKSVQSFFYETKYAHNHYIQTLAETGIVGLILFVLMLLVCAAAVWFERRKKEDSHPLTPALGAALVFMAGHALMEVNFSYYAYLPIAFAVIALIALCCGDAIPAASTLLTSKVKSISIIVCSALIALFSYFLLSNISADQMVKKTPSMTTLVNAATIDKFEYADHMLSYVVNAANFPGNQEVQAQAAEYAAELEKLDSNTVPVYLASYYFSFGDIDKAFEMLEKYLRYCASDENAWAQAVRLLKANYSGSDKYYDGVVRIIEFYKEWNANNLGTIQFSDSDRIFLNSFGLGKDN